MTDTALELAEETLEDIECFVNNDEITLSIYRLGRIVIANLLPKQLKNFPKYSYTAKQESDLLNLLFQLQSDDDNAVEYQQI